MLQLNSFPILSRYVMRFIIVCETHKYLVYFLRVTLRKTPSRMLTIRLVTCTSFHPGGFSSHLHVSDRDAPSELARHFHQVISSSCTAEDLRSRKRGSMHSVSSRLHLRHVQLEEVCAKRGSLVRSPSGRLAAWPKQRSLLWTSWAGIQVR